METAWNGWNAFLNEYGKVLLEYGANFTCVWLDNGASANERIHCGSVYRNEDYNHCDHKRIMDKRENRSEHDMGAHVGDQDNTIRIFIANFDIDATLIYLLKKGFYSIRKACFACFFFMFFILNLLKTTAETIH